MRTGSALFGLGLALTLAGCATPPPPEPMGGMRPSLFSSQSVRYGCEGGREIEVAYLNLNTGGSFAALHHDGRTALLQSRLTGSGVRFIALDEQHSLRWDTQGIEGTLRFLAADHTAQERVLLANCRALPGR